MVFYPYSFQAAFDPNQGTTAPRDSVGQVFAVGDRTFANPLPTVDLNGMPVTLTVGEFGYLPDFMVEDHTAVVWKSGEYVFQFATTIPVKGDTGFTGRSAYESAVEQGFEGTEAEWLESLKGANVLPTDEAIAAALTDGGLAQAATKALADASAQAEVAPVAEQVQQLGQSAQQAARAANRAYTVTRKPAAGGIPEHYIIRLANGVSAGRTVNKITGGNSLSATPPRETLDAYYARTQAPVIINASGYRTGGWWENQVIGLSIVNGVLVKGWDNEPGEDRGREGVVFMRDGTLKIYDETTTPEQIIEDGGWNAFGWGAAVYRNGQTTDFRKHARYDIISGRQLIGDTLSGDILIITFPGVSGTSGATGQNILDATAGLGINNLYILDGGGSTQTLVGGQYLVASSDSAPRAVPDALYFYAPQSGRLPSLDWVDVTPLTGTGRIRYRVIDQRMVEVVTSLSAASLPVGATQVAAAGAIPAKLAPDGNRRGGLALSGNYTGALGVSSDGSVYAIHQTGAERTSASGSCMYSI